MWTHMQPLRRIVHCLLLLRHKLSVCEWRLDLLDELLIVSATNCQKTSSAGAPSTHVRRNCARGFGAMAYGI